MKLSEIGTGYLLWLRNGSSYLTFRVGTEIRLLRVNRDEGGRLHYSENEKINETFPDSDFDEEFDCMVIWKPNSYPDTYSPHIFMEEVWRREE